MSDARLDLLTTRCCSPMNTWATVRGFLVVALERERIDGQIAVLEELSKEICVMCRRGYPHVDHPRDPGNSYHDSEDGRLLSCDCPAEIFDKIAALRKELENG